MLLDFVFIRVKTKLSDAITAISKRETKYWRFGFTLKK